MGIIILGGISGLFYTQLIGIFTVSIKSLNFKNMYSFFYIKLIKTEKHIVFKGQ